MTLHSTQNLTPTIIEVYSNNKVIRRKFIPLGFDNELTEEITNKAVEYLQNLTPQTIQLTYDEPCDLCDCEDAPIRTDVDNPCCLLCSGLIKHKTAEKLMFFQPQTLNIVMVGDF